MGGGLRAIGRPGLADARNVLAMGPLGSSEGGPDKPMAKGKLCPGIGLCFDDGHAKEAKPFEEQPSRPAAEAGGIRRRDGGAPAGDLRLRVLHQEPASPGVRQSAQGAAHLREGGRGQRAGRLRGSRHPPRRGRQGRGGRQRGTRRPRRARPAASGSRSPTTAPGSSASRFPGSSRSSSTGPSSIGCA